MTKYVKCDHCKKNFDDDLCMSNIYEIDISQRSENFHSLVMGVVTGCETASPIDLCCNCKAEINDWLREWLK